MCAHSFCFVQYKYFLSKTCIVKLVYLPTAYGVWGKVVFSQASVILSTVGVCIQGAPRLMHPPPSPDRRSERILLECILVYRYASIVILGPNIHTGTQRVVYSKK